MIPIKDVPTTLPVQDMIQMSVGLWRTRSRTWLMKGHWSSHKMVRLNFSTIPPRLTSWSNRPWEEKTFVHSNVQVVIFFCSNIYSLLNIVISLMHRICLFWSNIFVFTICKIFSYFFWCQCLINNSKPLEGGWRKRYHNLQYAFERTLLMRYMPCFKSLNTRDIREIDSR